MLVRRNRQSQAVARVAKRALRFALSPAGVALGAMGAARVMPSFRPTPAHLRAARSGLRRVRRAGRSRFLKKAKTLKKQVRELKRTVNNEQGTHITRTRDTGRVLSLVNQSVKTGVDANKASVLETAISVLKYYNPADPANLTTAAGATGTYVRKFRFETIYSSMSIVNNYQVPCKATIYLVEPKGDTSVTPTTAFTDGLTDVGGISSTSPLVYLTDSPVFNELWRIVKSTSKRIEPGRGLTLTHSVKNLLYDPAYHDSHTSTYKKSEAAYSFIIMVEGLLAHDTAANEQGISFAGVDYVLDSKWVVKYDAGVDLIQYTITDNSDTFTNAAVMSAKPVADNQSYSVP